MPDCVLFPALNGAWNVLPPFVVGSPRSIRLNVLAAAPAPAELTMTPFPLLPRNTLPRTVTEEPSTIRIPFPPVFPKETSPVSVFLAGVAAPAAACSIQTPASTLPFVSTVPTPGLAVVTAPVISMWPPCSTRMPCAVFRLNVVAALADGTLMIAVPVPSTERPLPAFVPGPFEFETTLAPIEIVPEPPTRIPLSSIPVIWTLEIEEASVLPVVTAIPSVPPVAPFTVVVIWRGAVETLVITTGEAAISKPALPEATWTTTGLDPDVVSVIFAGSTMGKTSPVPVLGPAVPPTTWMVVSADGVPMTSSARLIVLNAQPALGLGFPVPVWSLPAVGSTTYVVPVTAAQLVQTSLTQIELFVPPGSPAQ